MRKKYVEKFVRWMNEKDALLLIVRTFFVKNDIQAYGNTQ